MATSVPRLPPIATSSLQPGAKSSCPVPAPPPIAAGASASLRTPRSGLNPAADCGALVLASPGAPPSGSRRPQPSSARLASYRGAVVPSPRHLAPAVASARGPAGQMAVVTPRGRYVLNEGAVVASTERLATLTARKAQPALGSSRPRNRAGPPLTTQAGGGTLTIAEMKDISTGVRVAAGCKPQHRKGRIADCIPKSAFDLDDGAVQDLVLGLRLAPVNVAESALDVPLRLAIPPRYGAPALFDAPGVNSAAGGAAVKTGGGASIATRVARLLKGVSHEPQRPPRNVAHDGNVGGGTASDNIIATLPAGGANTEATTGHITGERRSGVKRGVAATRVLRDWEMKAQAAQRAGQRGSHAAALLAVGAMHYNAHSYGRAADSWALAAGTFDAAEDAAGACVARNVAGVARMRLGQFAAALALHDQTEGAGGAFVRAVSLSNIAVCYTGLGEHTMALEAHQEARRQAVDADDSVLITVALGNVGVAAMRSGDPALARTAIEDCLERCSVAGDKVGAAVCLLLLGDAHVQNDDHEAALFYFEHAHRLSVESGNEELAAVASVGAGVSRGGALARKAVFDAATAMGQAPTAESVIATLPQS